MNAGSGGICAQILLLISLTKGEESCLDEEVEVAKILGGSLGVNSYTFVENQENGGVLKKIGGFSESRFFSVVISLSQLNAILEEEPERKRFFERKTILVTKEKMNFTSVLQKISDLNSVTWVVLLDSLEEIETFYIPLNSNFFTVHCSSNSVVVSKVYNIKPGLRMSVKHVKDWPRGDDKGALQIIRHHVVNFENASLNLLYYSSEEECREKSKHVLIKMECFHREVVDIISGRLNFTISRVLCPERQYPYNFPNGSLSEMFLILQRGEADLSSGSYIVNNIRMPYYDFAWPVFTTKSLMYIKYESSKGRWRAYLRPISIGVWQAMASWILITGFLLQFFHESRVGNFKFRFSLFPEFLQFMYLTLQVFCNQGLHNISRWYSNRIVFILTFFLFMSLYQAYSGFLISSLTISTPYVPFTDIGEFFDDGTYKIMTLKKGFHNYYVKKVLLVNEGKNELLLNEEELPVTSKIGIEKLCTTEKLTFVEFRENIVQHEIPCKIMELPKPMLYQSIGLGLPKNSPLQDILIQHITVLRSTGVLHRMRRYLLSFVRLQQKETSRDEFINVSFWHVISIFFIIGIGTLLSVIIFLFEICCNFGKSRTRAPYSQICKRKLLEEKYIKRQKYSYSNFYKNKML